MGAAVAEVPVPSPGLGLMLEAGVNKGSWAPRCWTGIISAAGCKVC